LWVQFRTTVTNRTFLWRPAADLSGYESGGKVGLSTPSPIAADNTMAALAVAESKRATAVARASLSRGVPFPVPRTTRPFVLRFTFSPLPRMVVPVAAAQTSSLHVSAPSGASWSVV
jgi:hypothetical protein